MASTPEQKNEGTIASRLRSCFKKTSQTKEGVEGKPSRVEKVIDKFKTGKITKSSDSSKTKDLSSKILDTSGKPSGNEEKKDNNPQLNNKPMKHYTRLEGNEIENRSKPQWKCELCKHDLTYKEEQERSTQDGDELQNYLLSSQGGEEGLSTILPEVAVLPCSHVFHYTCLSALPFTHLADPSCPMCANVTMPL